MRQNYTPKDLRTLRLLHEYGFTDSELADHLGLGPLAVRHMRGQLALPPNGSARGIVHDRRVAVRAARMHPAQSHLGGHSRNPAGVILKLVDDRSFVEA